MSGGFSYSKWDNLELSDDEDFECHPNVDKASMVRWKQAEVHRKRRERQDKIDALTKETSFNNSIVTALEAVSVDTVGYTVGVFDQMDKALAHSVMVQAHTDRDPRWQAPVADPFFMKRVNIEALNEKLKAAAETDSLNSVVSEYKKLFEKRNKDIVNEIKTEQAAIDSKISSETIKEGFSKSRFPLRRLQGEEEEEQDEVYISDPKVDTFSKLTNLEASYKFIQQNSYILAEKYHDQILAEAFNLAMKGEFKRCQECVHQSLLLQYCKLLGKDGVMLFFQRLTSGNHKAKDAFMKDVLDTYKRISDRVKVLKTQEREEEEREKREGEARAAAALQEDGSYKLPVTAESTEEDIKRAEVFDQLPVPLQRALLTQDVDEINGFLSSSSKEDTEKYITLATSVGLISLSNEDE
ncbi:hypothetical protein BDR26DRAFT_940979 [Obelidium mucronatum]|nr:hypothetical protein BDR26DRAFT_940979 [Obelidium mucronatum]